MSRVSADCWVNAMSDRHNEASCRNCCLPLTRWPRDSRSIWKKKLCIWNEFGEYFEEHEKTCALKKYLKNVFYIAKKWVDLADSRSIWGKKINWDNTNIEDFFEENPKFRKKCSSLSTRMCTCFLPRISMSNFSFQAIKFSTLTFVPSCFRRSRSSCSRNSRSDSSFRSTSIRSFSCSRYSSNI